MVGVLQYVAVVAIATWMFWRIFDKAGLPTWWAWLACIPIFGLLTPIHIALGLLIGIPVVMLWVLAFARWPALDGARTEGFGPGYEPPAPALFKGRFRRSVKPSAHARTRRGVSGRPRRRDNIGEEP